MLRFALEEAKDGRRHRGKIKGEGGTVSENATLFMVHGVIISFPF